MRTQVEHTTKSQGTRTEKSPLTEGLRDAIAKSGMSYYAIERATGVTRPSIIYFMRGEKTIRLNIADRLADYFGLEVRPRRKE
jgi:plasmid maintenance system antidote protein VapI